MDKNRHASDHLTPWSGQRIDQFFSDAPFGLAMIDHETGQFLEVNPVLLKWTGYSREEFLELKFWDITPKEYNCQEEAQRNTLNDLKRFGLNEKEYIRKDGSRFPIRISGFSLTEADGRQVVWGVIEDITEVLRRRGPEVQMDEQLRKRAFYDVLTNLPNRYLFADRLHQTIANSKWNATYSALLFLDLDRFKELNDSHGHLAGDLLLAEVASRIRSCVREVDTVARYAGDEFVVLLSELDINQTDSLNAARIVACRIQHTLQLPYQLDLFEADNQAKVLEYSTSASIGAVMFQGDQFTETVIIKAADTAMYQAKNAGGNQVVFNQLFC
jgi:diguanylate cyclase (GGDEF)-like protein/PAS domain S-box-containing protein